MTEQTTVIWSWWYVWFGFRPFVPGILILGGMAIAPWPAILLMRLIRWAVQP